MEQVNRDAQWPYCLYLYLYGYLFNQQTYLSLYLYLDRKSGRRHGLDMWNTSHTHTHTHTPNPNTSPGCVCLAQVPNDPTVFKCNKDTHTHTQTHIHTHTNAHTNTHIPIVPCWL